MSNFCGRAAARRRGTRPIGRCFRPHGLAKLNALDPSFNCKADGATAAVLDAVQAAKSTFAGAVPPQSLSKEWRRQCGERYGQVLQVLMRLQPEFARHAYWLKPPSFIDGKHLDAILRRT